MINQPNKRHTRFSVALSQGMLIILASLLAACDAPMPPAETPIAISVQPTVTSLDQGSLSYNSPVEEFLPDHTVHLWQFQADEGDEITIQVDTNNAWLPLLTLQGPDGTLAEQIMRRRIEAIAKEGSYRLVIGQRYGGGAYRLQVDVPPTPTPSPTLTPTPMSTATPSPTPMPSPFPTSTVVLGTGDVQITLRWSTLADLDLHVTTPAGDTLNFMNRRDAVGGQLDVDANHPCDERSLSPVENIFWPEGESPTGRYVVRVHYHPLCGDEGPTDYEVTINVRGRTMQRFTGRLSGPEEWADVTQFNWP